MADPQDIFDALAQAAELRRMADDMRREADALETEWVGAASGDVLTVERLVQVIRKVGGVERLVQVIRKVGEAR